MQCMIRLKAVVFGIIQVFFEKAGTSTDAFTDWNTFGDAMTKIADLGDDAYGT